MIEGVVVSWTSFFFSGNLFYGWVRSPSDWDRVKEAHAEYDGWPRYSPEYLLSKARVDPRTPTKFGFDLECSGSKTLREFFVENGMTP